MRSYEVPVRFYKCVDSGEEFTTGDQDEEWSTVLYSQYRQKHGIPSPDQIHELRSQIGLSLQELTSILGFGTNQLSQYEKRRGSKRVQRKAAVPLYEKG